MTFGELKRCQEAFDLVFWFARVFDFPRFILRVGPDTDEANVGVLNG
jgi:hypothetical protein